MNEKNIQQLKYKDLNQIQDRENLALLTSGTEVLSWIYSLQDLPYREYSIASIMQSGSLDLVVRQEITAQDFDLGSGLLIAYTSLGTEIKARVSVNPAFHSIKDIQQPIILIGNSSGIAGLVAHLQQRAVCGATQNWLIFSERYSSLYAVPCTNSIMATTRHFDTGRLCFFSR